MGKVLKFQLRGSTKLNMRRSSGRSLRRASPRRAKKYFVGMEPLTAQQSNVCLDSPSRSAFLMRLEPEPKTSATVIAISEYIRKPKSMSTPSQLGMLSSLNDIRCQVRKKIICSSRFPNYDPYMANRTASKKGRRYAPIGERLERIQALMGYGDEGGGVQMAKALGLTEGQWSVFRSGSREIKPMYAARLVRWCAEYLEGATMDYIYLGGPSPRPRQRALPGLRRGA